VNKINSEEVDQEQSTSLTATRVETTHGPTYSMARAIGQYTASPELAVDFLSLNLYVSCV